MNLLLNIVPRGPQQAQGAVTSNHLAVAAGALFGAGPTTANPSMPSAVGALQFGALLEAQEPAAMPLDALVAERDTEVPAEGLDATPTSESMLPSGTIDVAATPLQATLVPTANLIATESLELSTGASFAIQGDTLATNAKGATVTALNSLHQALQSTTSTLAPLAAHREAIQQGGENALLQLTSQSVVGAAAALATLSADTPVASPLQHGSGEIKQPLAALLGERLQVQIARRSEHATVRLDPPSMGTIEIIIRQEAGQLHVHLRASNSEVARQLHVIGETLRQDLVQRQHNDVFVQVSDSSREGERQRQRQPLPWQNEPGRALNETAEEQSAFSMNVDNESMT